MYVLDIDINRNGNNLKLKVKSEFSLSMGLMVINHSNPYIHSTTVLCDNAVFNRLSAWLTVVANPDPSTMKRRKLTAAHIVVTWSIFFASGNVSRMRRDATRALPER